MISSKTSIDMIETGKRLKNLLKKVVIVSRIFKNIWAYHVLNLCIDGIRASFCHQLIIY